jgi:hypothetical protein
LLCKFSDILKVVFSICSCRGCVNNGISVFGLSRGDKGRLAMTATATTNGNDKVVNGNGILETATPYRVPLWETVLSRKGRGEKSLTLNFLCFIIRPLWEIWVGFFVKILAWKH